MTLLGLGEDRRKLSFILVVVALILVSVVDLPETPSRSVQIQVSGQNITSSSIADMNLVSNSFSERYIASFVLAVNSSLTPSVTVTVPKSAVPDGLIPTVTLAGFGLPAILPQQFYAQDKRAYNITYAPRTYASKELNIVMINFGSPRFPALIDLFAIAVIVLVLFRVTFILMKSRSSTGKFLSDYPSLRTFLTIVLFGIMSFLSKILATSPDNTPSFALAVAVTGSLMGVSALMAPRFGATLTGSVAAVLLSMFDPTDAAFVVVFWVFLGFIVDFTFDLLRPARGGVKLANSEFIAAITSALVIAAYFYHKMENLALLPSNPVAVMFDHCSSITLHCPITGVPLFGIVAGYICARLWSGMQKDRRIVFVPFMFLLVVVLLRSSLDYTII